MTYYYSNGHLWTKLRRYFTNSYEFIFNLIYHSVNGEELMPSVLIHPWYDFDDSIYSHRYAYRLVFLAARYIYISYNDPYDDAIRTRGEDESRIDV